MKITKTDLEHIKVTKTVCEFEIEDVEPIDQVAYRDSGKLMRPTNVRITVTNGKVGNLHITGPRINKNGDGAPITREWYRYTDDTPTWVDELREQALAAYRAEHDETPTDGCGGKVVVEYTTDDDGIHLACQACEWRHALGFWPDVSRITAQARHEAARARLALLRERDKAALLKSPEVSQ